MRFGGWLLAKKVCRELKEVGGATRGFISAVRCFKLSTRVNCIRPGSGRKDILHNPHKMKRKKRKAPVVR
jgi:hypothetical protein